MSGVVWDFGSAARISRAVRKIEQTGQSQFDGLEFAPLADGNREWVRTPSSLPGGYDGSDPLDGVKVVRLPDGTIHAFPQTVSILDPNGTALAANTIYPAQFAGTYEVSAGVFQGLYLVHAGGEGSGSGLTVGYYNGGTVSGGQTEIVVNGSTMNIGGNPWGTDAANAFNQTASYQSSWMGGSRWSVLLRDLTSGTFNYHIVPFVLPVEVKMTTFLFFNPSILVCRRTGSLNAFNFVALDWAKLIPMSAAGSVFTANIALNPNTNLNQAAWNLISVNLASPVSSGSGVSFSGSSFPSGMGGAFPAPTAGTNEVI